ncbi:helix-turn-helix domain-containing protein [Exiguobacterium sp. AM39-5BH]|uniref:helix-turn-helix domain-containing protein n=1 Tax=Exiguobacterium sp. AM39-5BH TaxID=2292355 RepID=UPI000FE21687|nr:helix-turn-helix domain-containing protein [Exiguobacterium sp. AM39-5BH]RHB51946.1 helix-turn-helix domain-containing protein [Exiguobacterium sp. AM39-5BH]
MTELGTFLKQRREASGLTLDQIQQTTKIQKRYIIAIEEGDYKNLPGSFYARAFIKTYAESLGLDVDELYETYAKDLPKIEPQPTVQLSRKQTYSKASETSSRVSRWVPKVMLVLVAFLLMTAVYYVVRNLDFGDQNTSPAEQTNSGVTIDQNKDVPEEEPVEEEPVTEEPVEEAPVEEKGPIAVATTNGADLTYEIATADKLTTEIHVKKSPSTYVGVRDTSLEGPFLAPEYPNQSKQNPIVIEDAETDTLRIRIGLIGGVEKIVVNGRELELADSPVTQNIFVKRVDAE